LDHLPEQDQFDAARKAAEEWFMHLDRGGSPKSETIAQSCQAYADRQRREKGEAAGKDADGTFARVINSDPLGALNLAKAKPTDFDDWRKRIIARGSPSYANRIMNHVRAALNYAYDRGMVPSNRAWK